MSILLSCCHGEVELEIFELIKADQKDIQRDSNRFENTQWAIQILKDLLCCLYAETSHKLPSTYIHD